MYPSLEKCPEQIDLVGIVVPPNAVLDSVKQAIENDVKATAIITAGFGEVKTEESQRENKELVKKNWIREISVRALRILFELKQEVLAS